MIWRFLGVIVAGLGFGALYFGALALWTGEVAVETRQAGFTTLYSSNPAIFTGAVLFYFLGGIFLLWLGQSIFREHQGDA